MELKTDLNLIDRKFEVDLAHLAFKENLKTLHPEVLDTNGWLELPMGRGFLWFTTALPKGTFDFEIKLGETKLSLEGDPIECEIHNSGRKSKGQFKVDGCRTDFKLFFNPSTIKDCPETIDVNRTYILPFRLVLNNINDSDDCKEFEDYLEITIKAFKPSLIFEFIPKEKEIVYSKDNNQKPQVGVLRVSHNAPFKCAPDISNERFHLQCIIKEPGNQENPIVNEEILRLIVDEEECIECIVNHLSPKGTRTIEYPVILDLNNVQNPQSAKTPDKCEVHVIYQERLINTGSFNIKRNPNLTRILTTISMPQLSGETLCKDISWSDGDIVDMGELLLEEDQKTDINLRFENTADADDRKRPHAAVLVWGIKIASIKAISNKDGILMKEGKSLTDMISIDVNESQKWSLKHHDHCEAKITIRGDNLLALRPSPTESETFAELLLEIYYHAFADKTGELYEKFVSNSFESDQYLCHQSFKIKLKHVPQSEWLCVDFGTSAVVASFADSIWEEDPLIDLKSQKLHLLKQVYTDSEKAKIEVNDENDKLISSSVFFNDSSTTSDDILKVSNNPTDYREYKIWFSPSAKAVRLDYQLPCLKNIMGYKHLPNIFADSVKNFKYYICVDNANPVEKTLIDKKGKISMEVDMVSQAVYKQLFCHYLSQRLKNENELEPRPFNKLVLSVPNTYTPLNTESIRRLARKVMPDIFPEYLYTVSESDAVACYYLSHFSQFVQNTKDIDSELLHQLSCHENVLIYDMGAGTLDLTWFEKKKESELTTVTVKGKMGISKAGNYLDYVIANIITQLYERSLYNGKRGKNPKQGKTEEPNVDDSQLQIMKDALILDYEESVNKKFNSKDRKALKDYVKELKKCLDHGNNKLKNLIVDGKKLELYIDEQIVNFKDITINDIVNHDDFKKFLDDITKNVLHNFASRFGDDEKMDVDVLVFSGRSTSLQAIRNSVKKYIKYVRKSDTDILFADICEMRFSKDIRLTGKDNSLLKTVVTHGALAYANFMEDSHFVINNSEPFFATYGIVLKWNNGVMDWIPLIGKEVEKMSRNNGIYENEWKSDTKCAEIDLIQSYSPNVLEDYQNHNFEAISKLGELGGRNWMKLRWDSHFVEGKTSVLQYFRSHQDDNGVELNPHDDFNNETLRKSLWPVTFVKEKRKFK